MTAPDSLCLATGLPRAHELELLRISIDDAFDPAYLPFIAVRDWELGARHGFSLQLASGGEPNGGAAALKRGACDLLVARPLSLLEQDLDGFEPIGCLFDAPGGVLVREDRLAKLRMGELLRVASTTASVPAGRMCRRILQGWAGTQGLAVAETLIAVDPAPSAAVADYAAVLAEVDAVWPAYAHTHATVAQMKGTAVRMITAEEGGMPSISAVGLFARQGRPAADIARHTALMECLEAAAARLASDLPAALDLWRRAGDDRGFAAEIVAATLPLLKTNIDRQPREWQAFKTLLEDA